jgi:hypothetical protein
MEGYAMGRGRSTSVGITGAQACRVPTLTPGAAIAN